MTKKQSGLFEWFLGKDTFQELERIFHPKKSKAKVNKVKGLYK